jgi:thiosulfate dehydrogenase [quinone] large subunit
MPLPPRNARAQELAGILTFWTLRLWIGMRTLIAGIEKYAGKSIETKPLLDEFGQPDINGAMVSVEAKVYGLSHYHALPAALASKFAAEPLIPGWALSIYSALLGPALVLLGIAVLVGVAPRISLFLTGVLYTSLTLGLVLLNESGGIAWLGIHVLMIAVALRHVEHNRIGIFQRW